jgi:hypothetical protein
MAMLLYQNGAALSRPAPGADSSRLCPGRSRRRRTSPGDAAHAARARFRLARLRPPLRRGREDARNCSMPASACPSKPRQEAVPSTPIRASSCSAGARSHCRRGLESFCAREVFTPLGMTSTCFRPPADWRSAIPPTEEDSTFRHRIIQGEVQDENCFVLGGAAAMPAFSPTHSIRCFTRNASSATARRAAPPQQLLPRDHPTLHHPPPAAWQFPGAGMGYALPAFLVGQILQPPLGRPSRLCGNFPVDRLSSAGSPSCCLPIAPGPTARARPFAPSVPPSTTPSWKHWGKASGRKRGK